MTSLTPELRALVQAYLDTPDNGDGAKPYRARLVADHVAAMLDVEPPEHPQPTYDLRPCVQCGRNQAWDIHVRDHPYVPRSATRAELDASEAAELAQRPAEWAFWRELLDQVNAGAFSLPSREAESAAMSFLGRTEAGELPLPRIELREVEHNPNEARDLGAVPAVTDPSKGIHVGPAVRLDLHPNTRYVRSELAPDEIPEPYLKLAAGGQVWLVASAEGLLVEGGTYQWKLTPARLRQMAAHIAMMLRMSGAEPDPGHPWFTGLVVEGEVLRGLRELVTMEPRSLQSQWDRDRAVVDRMRLLIEQNDARLRDHDLDPEAPRLVIEGDDYLILAGLMDRWAPVQGYEAWKIAVQVMVRLGKLFAAQAREPDAPVPAPDLDPDSVP